MPMKVLLVDTAFSAMPIYDYLVSEGHEVWVMGNRPVDILARRAGEYWVEQDYSRADEVAAHIERLGIERIVPGCTDVSMNSCIALGLDYLDTEEANESLANKHRFRELCAELDLPAPREIDVDAFPRPGRFICKPVDGFSGRGISVFDGEDNTATDAAFCSARAQSARGEALAEPFIEGELHSYTSFLEGGQPTDWFFVREGSSIDPFAVDTSYVSNALPESCRLRLSDAVSRIASALELRDGLIHTQFIWTGNEPYIVEMARRCPGDLYALLIEYSTGYRYAAKYASYFVGATVSTEATPPRALLRHTVTADAAAIFSGLRLEEPLPVKAFYPLGSLGAELAGGHAGRAGVLFCEFDDYAAMKAAEARFLGRAVYRVE